MGYNYMVKDSKEAMEIIESNDCTAMPVEGGYMVLEWSDYYRRLKDEAASLYDGGWRASDPDCVDSLIEEYCKEDNSITREWAEQLKGYMATFEGLEDVDDPEISTEWEPEE